jgi:hypothetical protein
VPAFWRENPWYAPLSAAARALPVQTRFPTRAELGRLHAEAAAQAGVVALAFVPPVRRARRRRQPGSGSSLASSTLYDGSIALHDRVPTRSDDWHDFFNALCFATWPRAKRALHARQYQALRAQLQAGSDRLPGRRSRERDALTLFDEGGVLLMGAADLGAPCTSQGREPAPQLIAAVAAGSVVPIPFGHALFQHWIEGEVCPGAYGRALRLPELPRTLDALLAEADRALTEILLDPSAFLSPADGMHLRLDRLPVPPLFRHAAAAVQRLP